jgi:hypothetical protein
MNRVAERREEIYDYFHASDVCEKYFFAPEHESEYAVYYTSMYLLQDSTESLMEHRGRGFSGNPLQAYIEFWGVMQAAIIQQDSISELYAAIAGKEHNSKNLTAWQELRTLRNVCAGHPAKKDRPKKSPVTRSFMGRNFGGYESFCYERWQKESGVTHPSIKLGELFDQYAKEAEAQLCEILQIMKQRWPV